MQGHDLQGHDLQDQWVGQRLAALEPSDGWQPDATRGLVQFRERQRAHRVRRTRWTWAAIAASVSAIGLLLLTPPPCSGAGCSKSGGEAPAAVAFEAPASGAAQKAARPVLAAPAPPPAPARSFKESGSVIAPVTVEIFSDYECPHCATVFLQTMPEFVRDFVKTGKVKLIHRDFPLSQHPYARLAARYANAAGMLGYYDVVAHQIFQTQATWELSGDVGTQVALVLPRNVMDKVRNLVQNDSHLDDTVGADVTIGRQDQLNQTPTMVVVYKGKRQLLAPIPPYELLKSYFDELLTK